MWWTRFSWLEINSRGNQAADRRLEKANLTAIPAKPTQTRRANDLLEVRMKSCPPLRSQRFDQSGWAITSSTGADNVVTFRAPERAS